MDQDFIIERIARIRDISSRGNCGSCRIIDELLVELITYIQETNVEI